MTQTITEQTVVSRVEDLVSSQLEGEAVILNLESGIYYGLNEVGAYVWQRLDTPQAVADLQAAILAEYEVEPERCRRELLALLAEMAEAGLVGLE